MGHTLTEPWKYKLRGLSLALASLLQLCYQRKSRWPSSLEGLPPPQAPCWPVVTDWSHLQQLNHFNFICRTTDSFESWPVLMRDHCSCCSSCRTRQSYWCFAVDGDLIPLLLLLQGVLLLLQLPRGVVAALAQSLLLADLRCFRLLDRFGVPCPLAKGK